MYESSTSAAERCHRASEIAEAFLAAVNIPSATYQDLADFGRPLTFHERHLAADCAFLVASAYEQAAAAWEAHAAGTPQAARYRTRARQWHDAAALHYAVAVIAPDRAEEPLSEQCDDQCPPDWSGPGDIDNSPN